MALTSATCILSNYFNEVIEIFDLIFPMNGNARTNIKTTIPNKITFSIVKLSLTNHYKQKPHRSHFVSMRDILSRLATQRCGAAVTSTLYGK